ncbi:MAG: hypothetical protein U0531_17880 [Dehalococcoidia bacterium]
MRDLPRRAARSLEGDPRLIASALAAYRRAAGMEEETLAAWLGTTPARLPKLALCPRPTGPPGAVEAETRRIAAYAGCDPDRLARLLAGS